MIPQTLAQPDYRFIKLNGKRPFEVGWQKDKNYSSDDEGLQQWISTGNNYGVCGGYGNLLVVDFDDKKIEEEISPQLPPTFAVRTGGGGLHLYYEIDDPKSFKIEGVDFQGTGKQVVGPGSKHPDTGKAYEIVNDREINNIKISELQWHFRAYLSQNDVMIENRPQDSIIDEIRNKVDFLSLLSESGYDTSKNPTMCQLGHTSKSGECFSFDVGRGLWNCFHCGKGGDIFSFVMEHDNVSFGKSKDILAKKIGIKDQPGVLKIDNYLHNAYLLYDINPYYFDEQEVWWVWDIFRWKMVDNVDMEMLLDKTLGFAGQTVTSNMRRNYIAAMKWVGRDKKPKEAHVKWIQFCDKAYSIESGNLYDVTPEYFFTNPIPHKIGDTDECKTINKLFCEWVGEENINILYELIAYCCYRSYPMQIIFCLNGGGRNGKSCFLRLLTNFLGLDNICSTELDLLVGNNSSRFESSKLYKKLVCQMGETNFGVLTKSSVLKRLTGGDTFGFEMKGKKPFDDFNYAKIVIASNSLPISDDTSDGFYRRWIIVDFPNQFPEGKDIMATIPSEEYEQLSRRVCNILPELLKKGMLTGQSSFEERKKRYIMASNPLFFFIEDYCIKDPNAYVRYSEFYTNYVNYLKDINKRIISKREFSKVLTEEGYEVRKTSKKINDSFENDRWIEGIDTLYPQCATYTKNPTQQKVAYGRRGNFSISGTKGIKEEEPTTEWDDRVLVWEKCMYPVDGSVCGKNPCNMLNEDCFCKIHFYEAQQPQKVLEGSG